MDGYAQVYEQEYPRIVRTVYLVLSDAGRAEDITQEAFVLFYYEDLLVSEVAQPLGMSESAVKMSLHRARRALATRLDEEVSDVC